MKAEKLILEDYKNKYKKVDHYLSQVKALFVDVNPRDAVSVCNKGCRGLTLWHLETAEAPVRYVQQHTIRVWK